MTMGGMRGGELWPLIGAGLILVVLWMAAA